MKRSITANRLAGVCLHITSLPGEYGIGEIGAAAQRFIATIASMNLGIWQILPTGPTGYGNSPYQSLSTFAGNELLIDINSLIQLGLLKAAEAATLHDLGHGAVDYGSLIPRKHALLSIAADRFESVASTDLVTEFEQFVHLNDERWLHDYALFRVLKSRHGDKSWIEWDPPLAQRDSTALRNFESGAAREIAGVKVLQFIYERQWNALHSYATEMKVGLFGDMPLYLALDSADVWADRTLVRIDCHGHMDVVAGVPPDYFSLDGQLWGNPLYDWDRHAASGFTWWISRLKHAVARSDLLRIDHFRGLESYWAVPATATTARNGNWEPAPGAELFNALRSSLGNLPIVAENLGVITPEVELLRKRNRIPGMKVLQFEVADTDFDPEDIAEDCVVYTGTHDNDTVVGWFEGSEDDTRDSEEIARTRANVLRLTGGKRETIHTDLIRLAFATSANLAIAPMQDYLGLGSDARLNRPGTTRNNWRWRLGSQQLTPELIDSVHNLVVSGKRRVPD